MKFLRKLFRPGAAGASPPVLRVVCAQLRETSQQVEDAVTGVCASFSGMAARARGAVAETHKVLEDRGSQEAASVESSVEISRRTIGALLQCLERGAHMSNLAISSMEEIARTVSGIEALLDQIQGIAFANKLVALNAKIEAVHVGELGSGFEVVADEISRQAERSTGLAIGISEQVQIMRARADGAAGQLREFLAQGRVQLEESHLEADRALEMLLSLHRRTREALERSQQQSSRLSDDIAAAVVALQFQDRVKQRLEHVVEALEQLEQGSDGSVRGLHASYTMESERDAHRRVTGLAHASPAATGHTNRPDAAGEGGSPPAAAPEMEVELF